MKYKVSIIERLLEVIEVEADSPEEAEELVRAGYRNEDYVLTAENFLDVEFETEEGNKG